MKALAVGQPLDERFILIRSLGKGGMGEVWLVEDGELGDEVVAKVVPADAPEERIALLRQECRHARRLEHPNIVRVHDFHRGNGRSFITMAHIEGEDIGRLRRRPAAEIIEAAIPIADALRYAHAQGVIHRDLKASNVLLDEHGTPHLLDFGISRLVDVDKEELRLSGGGTSASMSPQQRLDEPPRPSDDIYALGVLLYDLLTGAGAITDTESPAFITPTPVPDALADLVRSMISHNPADRPLDMAEVKERLERMSKKTPVELTPPPRVRPIQPASLQPPKPGAARSQARSSESPVPPVDARLERGGVGLATKLGFVFLFLLLLGVIFVLPEWAKQAAAPATTPTPGEAALDAPAPAEAVDRSPSTVRAPADNLQEQAELRSRAEAARDRATRTRETLEAKGVAGWGGEPYAAANRSLTTGTEHWAARDYAGAVAAYEDAASGFDAVTARGSELLKETLAKGDQALASGNARAATRAFELALTLQPGGSRAQQGLSRAAVLNDVMAHLAAAEAAEQAGDLESAKESYRKALSLDSLAPDARAALARIDARYAEEAFTRAMSDGMSALARQSFAEARRAFEQAKALRPESPQVADGIAQAEDGLRLAAIAALHDQASAFEQREEWSLAAAQYQKVLAIDPAIRFAVDGKARSESRAELSTQIDYHLANPGRLQDDKVLQNAAAVLSRAEAASPRGPKLAQQVKALTTLLEVASTPLRVTLRSDDETDVVVYKVGRLGPFKEMSLQLRPGTYTVVGSRRGYRDVRRQLVVKPGVATEPLVVRCEEKI